MKDKTNQSIVDAINRLATGSPSKTNGKVSAVNVAKEAGISKATLYRYFESEIELRESYDALRKNGVRLLDKAPETLEQAYKVLKEEIKIIRSEMAIVKKKAKENDELKAHQIKILWLNNKRLLQEVQRYKDHINKPNNIVKFPPSSD